MEKNVGIVGLGLIGGSFARALREKCGVHQERLFACDKDGETLHTAKKEGLISLGYEPDKAQDMLEICDVVFLCLNPSSIIRFLKQWQNSFKADSLITDVAGTKSGIAAAALNFRADVDFIPGHPMAGSHVSKGSVFCDFTGKNYILTPISRNKPENIEFLKKLVYKMGFGRITEVTPEEHDRKIAFTSQLCHVIAASLIDCEEDTSITRFGGGSFEDLTRIAMLNAPMWTELFIENRAALLERINQFEASLDKLKNLISGADYNELEKVLIKVRQRRTAMNETNPNCPA